MDKSVKRKTWLINTVLSEAGVFKTNWRNSISEMCEGRAMVEQVNLFWRRSCFCLITTMIFFFHLFIYFHEMQTENIRRISIWTIFQIYPSWRKAIMQGPTFGVSPLPSLRLAGVSPGSSFGQQLRLTQDWLKGEILQEWRCSPSDWLENISSS